MTSAELDALWDFADPAASATAFRPLHEAGNEEAGTQLARALGLMGRYDEARAVLDSLADDRPLMRSRKALEYGRLLNSAGNPEEARGLFHTALQEAEAAGEDFYAVDAAHMLGIAYSGKEGEEWTRIALAKAQASDCPRARGWRGSLLNNLGWHLHECGQYDEALPCFEEALRLAKPEDKARVQAARWCVARCLRSLGRTAEALVLQRALLLEGNESEFVRDEIAACEAELNA